MCSNNDPDIVCTCLQCLLIVGCKLIVYRKSIECQISATEHIILVQIPHFCISHNCNHFHTCILGNRSVGHRPVVRLSHIYNFVQRVKLKTKQCHTVISFTGQFLKLLWFGH